MLAWPLLPSVKSIDEMINVCGGDPIGTRTMASWESSDGPIGRIGWPISIEIFL